MSCLQICLHGAGFRLIFFCQRGKDSIFSFLLHRVPVRFIYFQLNLRFYASGTKSDFVFLFVINPAFPSTTLPHMLLILPL